MMRSGIPGYSPAFDEIRQYLAQRLGEIMSAKTVTEIGF